MKRSVLAMAAALLMTTALIGCSSPEQQAIDAANDLFEQGSYSEALEQYEAVEADADEFPDMVTTMYENAKKLYEAGDYDNADDYFLHTLHFDSDAIDNDECSNYLQLCYAMESAKSDIGMLYRTYKVVRMSEEGFEPATQALQTEDAFGRYTKLVDSEGLYRSDRTYVHYNIVRGTSFSLGDIPIYSYLGIGSHLYATTLASEGAYITMDSEAAKDRSDNNDFSCNVYYTGEDTYRCSASYTDSVTSDDYELEFDLTLGDGYVDISNLSTNEPAGSELLYNGRYTKVE